MNIQKTIAFEEAIALASAECLAACIKSCTKNLKIKMGTDPQMEELMETHALNISSVLRVLLEKVREDYASLTDETLRRTVQIITRDSLMTEGRLSRESAEKLIRATFE